MGNLMSKELNEDNIINSTINNTVNNYGTIIGNVTAAQYSITQENALKEQYTIRPNFKDSERASHKKLNLAFDLQLDGCIDIIIQLVRDALEIEENEAESDERTTVFLKYVLVHFLLANKINDEEALSLIDEIISFDKIKMDDDFYGDVLLEKAKALVLSGKTAHARSILSLVKRKEKSAFWEVAGRIAFYEGNIEQTVKMYNVGLDNALKEYTSSTTEVEKKFNYQHYYAFLTLLGEVYREIQRPDMSLGLWKKAIDAVDTIGWQKEKARLLLMYIECLLQYERLEEALDLLEEAYKIKKDDDDDEFFWHYYNLSACGYLHRNSREQNDVQTAINSLYNLLNRGLQVRQAINVLRTISNIQAEHGYRECALNTLKVVDQIIEESGENRYKEEIDIQRNDIKESSIFFDYHVRHTVLSPTHDDLFVMIERYNTSEIALERLHLAFNIGMGYINVDADMSYNWLSDSVEQAGNIGDNSMVARGLIGQAAILFNKKSEETERQAGVLIDNAIDIMKNIPIWDVRARAIMFKGLWASHKENFKEAYQYFNEAKQIIDVHKVKEQSLKDYVSDYLDECEIILSKKQFTDLEFATIIDEVHFMDKWFPKYCKEMRQFLWYNRHEDIERLIISSHGSKAFMVSDNEDDIQEWLNGLDSLFDIVSFSSESDYHIEENWNFAKILPVPKNMKSKFFNVFCVLEI